MNSQIRTLEELLDKGEAFQRGKWNLRIIQSDECQSYVAWNEETREALAIDPKREDWESYLSIAKGLGGYLWIGVIDTHTHADHISAAPQLAGELKTSLLMHVGAVSQRVQLRVCADATLASRAAPVHLFHTPGHTADSITIIWGPFLFGGDTFLYGDTGRDDLPTGSPEAHFESIQKIKAVVKPDMLVLPGHDNKGGRLSTWSSQLRLNASLSQSREDFVREAAAFTAPAPRLFKESLKENFQ